MPAARSADAGFSPLDKELGLLPAQQLAPAVVEDIVRLGVLIPFAQVPALLRHFTGVTVSTTTVRRLTEAAGTVQEAQDTAAVEQIERTLPDPPAGVPLQLLSVDGAMVPLVDGTWSEVKTLVLGTVAAASDPASPHRTTQLSYFSRLTDAASFMRLATVETQRRGTETAQTVVAVVDGAEWCQRFIDHQRHDAVRILDFAHALEHLSAVAQRCYGPGTPAASEWLGQQAHALRYGHEETVITRLAELAATSSDDARAAACETHGYLSRRLEQIRYQTFVSAGYPIGSGCVESANKLVVEARLKGSGMHWSRRGVNAMLALRTVVANGRWEETWPDLWTAWRQQACRRTADQRQQRQPMHTDDPSVAVDLPATTSVATAPGDDLPPRQKTIVDGKPTIDHPWRKTSPFRAKR